MEGVRKLGLPELFLKKYYQNFIDEIYYIDIVSSLYGIKPNYENFKNSVEDIFIPICTGGGITSINDAKNFITMGADKVSINSGAVQNPNLINELANYFGSQCVVVGIDVKVIDQKFRVLTHGGREVTKLDLFSWLKEIQERGAGEIILTSVDMDGSKNGVDIKLCSIVKKFINIPIIYSGGTADINDIKYLKEQGFDGVAIGRALHDDTNLLKKIKNYL